MSGSAIVNRLNIVLFVMGHIAMRKFSRSKSMESLIYGSLNLNKNKNIAKLCIFLLKSDTTV